MPSSPLESWPATLDLSTWLEFSLSAQDSITRALALAEIGDRDEIESYRDHLQNISTGDPDDRCRQIAQSLLARRESLTEARALSSGIEPTPQGVRDLFDRTYPALREALRESVWQASSAGQLDLWRDHLLQEAVPEVVAIGLRLLSRYGTNTDAAFGTTFLNAENPGVVLAAIDLLAVHDTDRLSQYLLFPLHHPSAQVRFHAARFLRATDPDAADRFLNEALTDDDPFVRRLAILELSKQPTESSLTSFVRVIGFETQPLLLVKAGLILTDHPHLDMPPHVYDHLLMSQGLRKHVLNITLRALVQRIRDAGAISLSIEEYLTDLKRELASRRDDLTIALITRDLRHTSIEVRRQAFERCQAFVADPRIQKALRGRRRHESDSELQQVLTRLLQAVPETIQGAPPETSSVPKDNAPVRSAEAIRDFTACVSSGQLYRLPVREQIVQIDAISYHDLFKSSKGSFFSILQHSTERLVLLRVLKAFERWGSRADAEPLHSLLKRPDPAVIGQTLKTLAHLGDENITTILNPFLREDNLAVKAAALEAFFVCDRSAAGQFLQSMLESPHALIRRKALALAPLTDHATVESRLIGIMQHDPLPDLQMQAGCLIASNPSDRGLTALFRCCRHPGHAAVPEWQELWNSVRPTAALHFRQSTDHVDAWIEERVRNEEAAQARQTTATAMIADRAKVRLRNSATRERIENLNLGHSMGEALSLLGVFALSFLVFHLGSALVRTDEALYRRESAVVPDPRSFPAGPATVNASASPAPLPVRSPQNPGGTSIRKRIGGWVTLPATWTVKPREKQ